MSSSVFCFAVDLVGEGTAAVCDRVRAAGLSGITLAASYHEARDYLPHNPLTRVHYAPAGTAFHAATELYPPDLPPAPLLPVCNGRNLLAELVAAAGDGLEVGVWAVYLHNDGPAGQRDTRAAVQAADIASAASAPKAMAGVMQAPGPG